MKRTALPPIGYAVWGVAAYVWLCGWVLLQTRPVFWDEVPYLSQAIALVDAGSFRDWLSNNDAGPCGPLHPLLHYVLSAGTGILPVPWVRLPNLVLLALVLALTAAGLKCTRMPRIAALGLLAVPMVWGISGMALTEPSAMAGIALAMLAALRLGNSPDEEARPTHWLLALSVGVAIATLGRQTYVVAVPGLLLIAARSRREAMTTGLALALGLLPLIALFLTWGGIVPPKLSFVGGGLKPLHAVLAFSITGIVAVVLAPRVFLEHKRWTLPIAAMAATVNVATGFAQFTTLSSAQRMLGNPGWARFIEMSLGWAAVFVGAGLIAALAQAVWQTRDRVLAGAALAVFGLCAVCAAVIHQFSSRYAAMALPFLVICLARWMDFGKWAVLRCTTGAILGFLALRSYYLYAP